MSSLCSFIGICQMHSSTNFNCVGYKMLKWGGGGSHQLNCEISQFLNGVKNTMLVNAIIFNAYDCSIVPQSCALCLAFTTKKMIVSLANFMMETSYCFGCIFLYIKQPLCVRGCPIHAYESIIVW